MSFKNNIQIITDMVKAYDFLKNGYNIYDNDDFYKETIAKFNNLEINDIELIIELLITMNLSEINTSRFILFMINVLYERKGKFVGEIIKPEIQKLILKFFISKPSSINPIHFLELECLINPLSIELLIDNGLTFNKDNAFYRVFSVTGKNTIRNRFANVSQDFIDRMYNTDFKLVMFVHKEIIPRKYISELVKKDEKEFVRKVIYNNGKLPEWLEFELSI